MRTQPGPSQSACQQRQTKSGDAFELQKQIANPGSDQANPVVRGASDCISANGIERGIGGAIGDEREKKEDRGDQHEQPDELIQAAIAGRRSDQFQGFHQGAMQCAPSETAYTVKNPRARPLSQKRGESLEKISWRNRSRNRRLSNQPRPVNQQRDPQNDPIKGKRRKSMFAHP